MIIKKLVLHNFGVYASTNIFEFSGNKPIVLIGGMNGRGKTTFLEAVLIALYGSNSFAYAESNYSAYGKYLRAYVNTADGSYETFIELEFSMGKGNADLYCVRREWSDNSKRIKETVSVKKNGTYDSFLTENWSMFVEGILPSGLSNFFFFDGEKIAEIAAEDTNTQVKESIKTLLGISVLDQLESDIGRILSRLNKEYPTTTEEDELERLRAKKERAESDYNSILEELSQISKQQAINAKRIERAQNNYLSKGGEIVSKRQDLYQERLQLLATYERIQGQIVDAAASCLPLSLVLDLLGAVEQQSVLEHESQIAQQATVHLESLYKQYSRGNGSSPRSSVYRFMQFVREHTNKDSVTPVYSLSDSSILQLSSLLSGQMEQQKESVKLLVSERLTINKRIGEIDQYLSIEIDEKALSRAYKRLKSLEQEKIDLEVKVEELSKKKANLHGESLRTASDYNNHVEKMLFKLELNEDADRLILHAHHAVKIIQAYKIRLQSEKISQLAKTMTTCYKKLASKKNLIDHIEMDPVTLDFQYISSDGKPVPKGSLSAGEKQLMVISILWALAICSEKKLPVIIDTPLSRLDSDHRTSLINSYFPFASEQTIILSTDSEIDQQYYSLMKDNIGDEFTLEYDDDKKCSSIKRGYFVEEKQ